MISILLSEMLIQKMILLLDGISSLQLRNASNQNLKKLILIEATLIANQISEQNFIKQQSKKQRFLV